MTSKLYNLEILFSYKKSDLSEVTFS